MNSASYIQTDRYSTLARRFVASLIDTILFAPLIVAMFVVGDSQQKAFLLGTVTAALNIGYYIIGHGKYGMTFGKRVMNLRVVRNGDEAAVSVSQAFKRELPLIVLLGVAVASDAVIAFGTDTNMLKAAEYVSGLQIVLFRVWNVMDILFAVISEKRRSLHDRVGGTVVVRE
jgi:uncharacterized RDD family membrane protein YckC